MANPTRIRGIDYPSQTAAARALGVADSTVTCALARGAGDGIGTRPVSGRMPVVIDGVRYRTLQEAGDALGLHPTTIYKRLKAQREQRA